MLKAENNISKHHYLVANGIVVLLILVLIARFFQIQIYRHEKYKRKADVNRIRAVTVPAPRGLILDGNGLILVDNYPTYVLTAIPGEMGAIEERFQAISRCTGIDSALIAEAYHEYFRGRFVSTRLAKDLTFEQISKLEEHKLDLPGIGYEQFPERIFPSDARASHVLGYLMEVDQVIRSNLIKRNAYNLGDMIGWSGLEKHYENRLIGRKGVVYLQVDARGSIVGDVTDVPPVAPEPGSDIMTTLDLPVQVLLENELKQLRGVAIASDPVTGEILAYVSMPDYRPDLFTGTTPESEWSALLLNPDKPLLNRVTHGLYPPGSTLKMITAIALLERKLVDPEKTFECTGSYEFGDRVFRCNRETGHGKVNLHQAIAQSCNVYFYKVVQYLTLNQWVATAAQFGFGKKTDIDLPSEETGLVPDEDYMDSQYGRWGWSTGALLNLAIGQGDLLVTPIQMLNYINAIATHGQGGPLHLLKKIDPGASGLQPSISIGTWEKINGYLEAVIHDEQGTGHSANPQIPGLILAGKTGTSENPHGEDHAWFVGYGKMDNRMASIVVLIENGGHGGQTAAPIAGRAFKKLFDQQPNTQMVQRD